MGHRKNKNRQAIYDLVSHYEDQLESGSVTFKSADSFHSLIDYYQREYLTDRAIEVVGHALRQYGPMASFLVRKVELLLLKKEAEQALFTLDQLEVVMPGSIKAGILRAESLAMMDLYEEGIKLLDQLKLNASAAQLSQLYVGEALIYEGLKAYEQMYFVLKAALLEDPSNMEALSRMWYCVEYARKHEDSLELHERIIDEDPFNALAWYNLGAAHHYLLNYEEAIEAYEYAFLAKDDFEFAYRDCAEVCLYVENYHKALQCYQEVLERFEPDADLFYHIGLCYEKTGNYLVARNFYERAVEFDYYCAEAHYHIGLCFGKQMEWQKAISSFLKAVRIEDNNEDFHAALADAYAKVGNFKKAEAFYRLAADTAPEEPTHWIKLVRFLMGRGRTHEALETLDDADENTYGPALLYCRSACLFEMGDKQAALLVLEEALAEDFDAHDALFRMMPILEKDSEVRAVISIFQPE